MKRYTVADKSYECRFVCRAEEWMRSIYGEYPPVLPCNDCPFLDMIKALAEIEDKMEDDLK